VVQLIRSQRKDYDRLLFSVASMAKEAIAIFDEAAVTAGCNSEMARRMAYECRNYLVLVEDWMALMKIDDLSLSGEVDAIAPIARERQAARTALMTLCEQVKEDWVCKAATMRNHSVFMQSFADIATYMETTENPTLDLLDITGIMSRENRMIR
jgi:hypothetical protein